MKLPRINALLPAAIAAVMLFSGTSTRAWAQGGSDSSNSAGSTMSDTSQVQPTTQKKPILQGGVKHAEELPSLEDSLRPGGIFSDELLMKDGAPTNNLWFYIPAWFAGTRHVDDAMIVSRFDFKTGEQTEPMLKQLNRQDSTSGYQKDRKGGIWDYKRLPTIQHVESDLVNAVLYVKEITPLKGDEDQLVIKYQEISISLNKRNNKILNVVQQEQINTITCAQPGLLRIDVSVKSFGWDGSPQRLEQSVMMSKVIKPFEQKDTYKGIELRPLFRDYLISHNLKELVPEDLAAPDQTR